MSLFDLFLSQLIEPFRIGLLFFLLLTTKRTAAQTGNVLPVVLGALFVAVLIPTTLGGTEAGTNWMAVATGIVANIVILAVIYALWQAFDRLRAG